MVVAAGGWVAGSGSGSFSGQEKEAQPLVHEQQAPGRAASSAAARCSGGTALTCWWPRS
jgi:hypothetical protein